MNLYDYIKDKYTKTKGYFGIGSPGLGTFGNQVNQAKNNVANQVRQSLTQSANKTMGTLNKERNRFNDYFRPTADVRARDVVREIPGAIKQTFSREGLGSKEGLREAGKGVLRSGVSTIKGVTDTMRNISPGYYAINKINPNLTQKRTQESNAFLDNLNQRLSPRGTEMQQNINKGFYYGGKAGQYMAVESPFQNIPGLSKAGSYLARRGADVLSGQLITPKEEMAGGSRLKEAGLDVLMGAGSELISPIGKQITKGFDDYQKLTPAQKQGGFIKPDEFIPKKGDDLVSQARKYKSADEFIYKNKLGEPERFISDKKIKIPDVTYRGVSDVGEGTGFAAYGAGKYSASTKKAAKEYGNKIIEITDKPRNPIQFKTDLDFKQWESEIAKRTGLGGDKRLLTKNQASNTGIEQVIKKIGYDGITIGSGKDMYIVKFDNTPSTFKLDIPTKSQLTDIWNKSQPLQEGVKTTPKTEIDQLLKPKSTVQDIVPKTAEIPLKDSNIPEYMPTVKLNDYEPTLKDYDVLNIKKPNLSDNIQNDLISRSTKYEEMANRYNMIDNAITSGSGISVTDIQKIGRSRMAQSGDFDITKIKGFDEVAEAYRDMTGKNLTSSEVFDEIMELPTKTELSKMKPISLKPRNIVEPIGVEKAPMEVIAGITNKEKDIPVIYKEYATRQTKKGFTENITNKANDFIPANIQRAIKNGKDKSTLSLLRESPLRNVEDVFGDGADDINNYLVRKVADNETMRTKWAMNETKQLQQNVVQNIGKKNSIEDQLAFDYAENKITLKKLQELSPKWEKIKNASDFARTKYDDYLRQINTVLTRYGYDPIPKRKDYITHIQELDSFSNLFGSLTNFDSKKLPTVMSGVNTITKPGKQWFQFAQKRKGGQYDKSLIGALEAYLPKASNQIFHTDSIQRGRMLEKTITGSVEDMADKQLSNFNSWLGEYVNNLAGKTSILDRGLEKTIGRNVLDLSSWARSRVSANMVGANVSSALTNFIPITQSLATTNKTSALRGLMEAVTTPFNKISKIDGIESKFLTRRFLKENIYETGIQKASKKASFLFDAIDRFTSESAVRGKYYELIKKGLSKTNAMNQADEYAARLITDRSMGQLPTLFNSKTLGLFTQFQTEVNNQLSFIFKDIPKMAGGNKLQLASTLGQVALFSYLYNSLYEKATGRRPAFDPIGVIKESYEDYSSGNKKANKNLIERISQQLPFVSTFTDGGRIPLSAALPDVIGMIQGNTTWQKEIKKPLYYIAPPFGGGQARKTIEGISAYNKGASTTDTGKVRFPIKQDTTSTIQSALFGQYSSPEAKKYFRTGQTPLSANQSDNFMSGGGKEYYNNIIDSRLSKNNLRNSDKSAMISGNKVLYKTESGNVSERDYIKTSKSEDVDLWANILGITKSFIDKPTSGADKFSYDKDKISNARKIYNSEEVPQNIKTKMYAELGYDEKDVFYDVKSNLSVAERTQFVLEDAKKLQGKELNDYLFALRNKSLSGSRVLTDSVIDNLVKEGIVSENLASGLNKYAGKSVGETTKKTSKSESSGKSGSSKAKKLRIATPKTVSLSTIKAPALSKPNVGSLKATTIPTKSYGGNYVKLTTLKGKGGNRKQGIRTPRVKKLTI